MAGAGPAGSLGRAAVVYGPLETCRYCGKPIQWYRGPDMPLGCQIDAESGRPHRYQCDHSLRPVQALTPAECRCGQVVYLDQQGRKWSVAFAKHVCPDQQAARRSGPPPRERVPEARAPEDPGGVVV